ncbi:sulfuric ester hydrolase [Aureococcus anophagefferens]|nr:sulfuric ester hydrolase [Aureococcus anophagefferens]
MDAVHNRSFGLVFQRAGYATALLGKYVNAMPEGYVPRGWSAYLANGGGDYFGPEFVARNAPGIPDGNYAAPKDAYTVSVVGNASVAFLERHLSKSEPVLLYCAPKAVHEPFNPPPWYADHWDPSWPAKPPMITAAAAEVVDGVYRNRWRSLMAVDDLVEALVTTVDARGATDRTYFVFTSDHGFQLGQLNMLMDKRHVYDWDTRVPLVIKGPGVGRGTTVGALVTNVDLAPTLAELCGVGRAVDWDGRSVAGPLKGEADETWRTSVLVEYYFNDANDKCVADAPRNGVPRRGRLIDGGVDLLYAKYENGTQTAANLTFRSPTARELFDTAADPWCTVNTYASADGGARAALDAELDAWFRCAGAACP